MRQGVHPVYYEVIYKDVSSDFRFLTRSTRCPKETEVWEDGRSYPVIKVEISSASHPFFTGQEKLIDTAGRIERFRKRYEKTSA